MRHPAAGLLALAAGFGANATGIIMRCMLLALGGTHGAGIRAHSTHFGVKGRFVAHQGGARFAGRGAVEACFDARYHACITCYVTDAVGGARLAFCETVEAVGDARLHLRGHGGMTGGGFHRCCRYCHIRFFLRASTARADSRSVPDEPVSSTVDRIPMCVTIVNRPPNISIIDRTSALRYAYL